MRMQILIFTGLSLFTACAWQDSVSLDEPLLDALAEKLVVAKIAPVERGVIPTEALVDRSLVTPAEERALRRRSVSHIQIKKQPTSNGAIVYFHGRAGSYAREVPRERSNRLSQGLERDIKRMWETERNANGKIVSTRGALAAARMVFNTIDLTGKTRTEVTGYLGDPSMTTSSYQLPFYDAAASSLVYRFDTGFEGLQVNIVFGGNDRVADVTQLNIE